MGWGTNKKKKSGNKYFNREVDRDGIHFDSQLERFAYDCFKEAELPFELKPKFELQPTHTGWDGETVRRINIFPDFIFNIPDKTIVVDTKGMMTEESKLKYKLLSYKLTKDEKPFEIRLLFNKTQIRLFVKEMKERLNG